MQGFFTPTEAGSVGTFAVLILTLFQKEMTIKGFIKAVTGTLRIACMVLTLIAGATKSRTLLRCHGTPYMVAEWLTHLNVDRAVIIP